MIGICIPPAPGRPRNSTPGQRLFVYITVIVLVTVFTVFLFGVFDKLQSEYDLGKAVREGFQW